MEEEIKLVNGSRGGKRKASYDLNGEFVNKKSISKGPKLDEDEKFIDTRNKSINFQASNSVKQMQRGANTGTPVLTENTFLLRNYLLPRNDAGNPMLYIKDVQHLILYATQGILSTEKPRWCSLSNRQHLKSVFVAVVESLSVDDLKSYDNLMPFLSKTLEQKFEVISPSQYGGCALEELLMVEGEEMNPMPIRRKATVGSHDSFTINRDSGPSLVIEKENWRKPNHKTTKLDLLMTSEEMKMEGYSMPLNNNSKTKSFKYSRKSYRMPTKNSPMFAVDCEMVSTTEGRELASVCIVDENLNCIYSTYVKPENQITDYNTKFSGITQEKLADVTTRLCDVQTHLEKLLPSDVILVGQSLNFDLDVLKMFHPFVIDTSSIYNLSGYKDRKSKLKLLAKLFLKREIQDENKGHCAREDAEASMQLVLLKLNKGYRYGNVIHGWMVDQLEDPSLQGLSESTPSIISEVGNKFKKENRKKVFFRTLVKAENVFRLASNAGRTSTLFGSLELDLKQTSSEMSDYRSHDSHTLRSCRDAIASQDVFLMVCHLCEAREALGGDNCTNGNDSGDQKCLKCFKRCLKDTDRRLKKAYNALPPRSLFVVLFTGRIWKQPIECQNGMCFVNIKPDQLL